VTEVFAHRSERAICRCAEHAASPAATARRSCGFFR